MTKAHPILMRLLVALVVLVVLVGASGVFYFKAYLPNTVAPQSFPQIDGELKLAGLDGPVDVYRDAMGIPHIYATTVHDLFEAQGFVHAQDRFWQMDFWRHIGSGRLSEMFGKSQVDTDSFLRTLGWRQLAEQEFAGLQPEPRAILTAYAEGVNAYLSDHQGAAISLEYSVLKLLTPSYSPEPWTPVNSLTWAKAMAWDLRGNMDEEIQRAILLKTLTPQQVDELFPPYPQDHPLIVPAIGDFSQTGAITPAHAAPLAALSSPDFSAITRNVAGLDALLGPAGSGIGSNNWAVAGSRSATGKPLLANDPHLGIQMPSIWYQVDLHCVPKTEACPFEVAGFSFAGVPGVIIGHNDRIAWAFTNVGPDVMDLYIEKINPDNPNQYEVDGKWVDMTVRSESITVGGGDPVSLTVRVTRHGPIISGTFGDLKDKVEAGATPFKDRAGVQLPEHYAVALRWTALEPSYTFDAIWGFNSAQNWQDFRTAARDFSVPAQNLLYADVDGNIGYQMPGRVPIRKSGDGRVPVPGWTDDYEWTGFIPFDELPFAYNPSSGYIVTANNQVPPRDYPHLVTTDWDYGFRAQRLIAMIEGAPGPIDVAYFQKMQGDNYDANAAALVPQLMQVKLNDPHLESVRGLLNGWDYQDSSDSAPAALFAAFWQRLLADTFDDDLPIDYWPEGGSRWFEVVDNLAKQPQSPWWDDRSTTNKVENRDDMFAKAFGEAVAETEKILGSDSAKWQWGVLHSATFRNGTLGESGVGLIEGLFNRGPFAAGGGNSIVNATSWDATKGFEVTDVPSMRMIVDLSNLNNSQTVHTTGESGHAYHRHYSDMADLWRKFQYYQMLWDQQSVMGNAEGHLKLIP